MEEEDEEQQLWTPLESCSIGGLREEAPRNDDGEEDQRSDGEDEVVLFDSWH